MNFSSLTFIFYFFPITTIFFLLLNRFNRKIADGFLIFASYIFYAWTNYTLALLLLVYSLIVYALGKYLDKHKNKNILALGITLLTTVLIFYKWTNFGITQINHLLHKDIKLLSLLMPLGLSFIIFETISYLVDIYKGERSGNLLETLLFLSLFTKVISGPIVLWKDFVNQDRNISFDHTVNGLERIIIGLSKKVIIADSMGGLVNKIQEAQYLYSIDRVTAWGYILIYSIQLYYDFSGYSDIALGLSEIYGFSFKENFNFPYKSLSVSEFFRRWHISLGTWFKEYIYIPLGGNRSHVYRNLFIVYLITGIWHGTGYTFIAWGIYLGIIVMIERYIFKKERYINTPSVLKQVVTVLLICLGWLIFSFDSMGLALSFSKSLIIGYGTARTFKFFFRPSTVILCAIAIIGSQIDFEKIKDNLSKTNGGLIIKYAILLVLFVLSFIYIIHAGHSPFLYFGF